ncbi:MAG: D-tyrosyl-tRNA(Tyr) deacylase [Planctomycetota bacterium]|jgi:D-tyrosyl-tRNA(Tyr) deacylase
MRVVIQRVQQASVTIEEKIKGSIDQGLLVLAGFENEDTEEDLVWICNKLVNLRIFNDEEGKMNFSVIDIKGSILLVSQFTLFASTKKGNRPSFLQSAKPDIAIPLYEKMILMLSSKIPTKTGEFGADMKVELLNDGPVTISIDSKDRV